MRRTTPAFVKITLGLALPAVLSSACGDDTAGNDAETSSSESGSETVDPTTTSPETTMTDPDSSSSGDPDTTGSSSTTDETDPDSSSSTGEPNECGNGAIDGDEECDSNELIGRDCGDFGFAGGELSCTDDCTYDISMCSSVCGDGIIDADEECEPDDLAGQDCVTLGLGFDDGVLACDAECLFDTSACVIMSCGNDNAEGAEVCDGTDLRGEDCVSQGFGSGTLTCADNCGALDDSGCIPSEVCGNELDDDLDDLTDCADPDCDATAQCAGQLITDCDADFCTLTLGGGPNGGDLCSCTVPAADHPAFDFVEDAACFFGNSGNELLFRFTTAYDGFTASTCNTNPGDSAIAVYATDPSIGGVPTIGCAEDAPGGPSFCSELAPNPAGPALPTPTGGAAELWIQVDEYNLGNYWDGATARVIDIELVNAALEVCSDGVDNDFDGAADCDDDECMGDSGCVPVETVIGCDATYCTFTADAGPNGGDLCVCVLPPGNHPQGDDIEDASCFGSTSGRDLLWSYDTTGYDGYSISSCETNPGDSSIAAFDGIPGAGVELACDEDASGETGFCSELLDSGNAGPPLTTPLPASNDLHILIDEWSPEAYWNGTTQRTFQIELISAVVEVCGDGIDNDLDGATDCDDDECVGVPVCTTVEEINGCDATFCTFTVGAGPNGGDLCVCVIPAGSHPIADDYADASCFGAFSGSGRDLLWTYDTTGYAQYTVSSCEANQGDSSIATFDGVPGVGVELVCSEDASGELGFCSELTDSLNGGPAVPAPLPASDDLQILVDEWSAASYWNGSTQRTFQIELIP
jgi:hypothetical protein